MRNLRRLSGAIVLVALSLVLGVVSVKASPVEPSGAFGKVTTVTPVLTTVLSILNSIGDDKFSTADLTKLVDPSTTVTQHYGPYSSTVSDSGTCGNNWADDTFQRHFTIFNKAGSVVVVEQFKQGNFVTPSTTPPNSNQSPGACNTSPPPAGNGGLVAAGVTGSLHGYFIIPIPTGISQSSNDPHCDATTMMSPPAEDCFTSTFINSHFNGVPSCSYPVVCSVTTFFFHYTAPRPARQGLIENEWKNASTDRGGNRGDIRST
jgi:hypothetical protein